MSTIAELKLIVDSSQLEQAKKVLDEFNASAGKVDGSGISKALDEASKKSSEFANKTQALIDRASELSATLKTAADSVVSLNSGLSSAGDSAKPLVDGLGKLSEQQKKVATASRESEKVLQREEAQRARLVASIKLEVDTYGMSRHQKMLYKAEQAGLTSQTSEYISKLGELVSAKEAVDASGKSNASQARADQQAGIDGLERERAANTVLLEQANNRVNVERQLAAAQRERDATVQKQMNRDVEVQETKNLVEATKQLKEEKKKESLSTEQLVSDYIALKDKIDPVTAAYDKLGDQMQKLQQFRRAKGSGGAALFDPKEIDQLEAGVAKSKSALDRLGATTGKTAKEMAFSMRGLPAQFTDVVVSLQGGQKPLTVLLQQGGQVKDMFGGIVPAFKAMGTYVLALITPLNLLIAGIGALAYAWYSGNKEADTFRKTILLTSASTKGTAQDFSNLSKEVANSNVTIGRASEVLNQVVQATNIHKDNLKEVTKATIAWGDLTGAAVEDIISDFNSLGKDPVNAIKDLQEKYRFLTPEIMAAVNSQLEMGRKTEAVRMLTEQLASTMQDKQEVMLAALGPVDNLLLSMKNNAKGFLDYFKDIGRGDVTADTLDIINRKVIEQTDLVDRLKRDSEGDSWFANTQAIRYEEANTALKALVATQVKAVELREMERLAPLTGAISEQEDTIRGYRTELEKATLAYDSHIEATKVQREEFEKAGIADTKSFETNSKRIEQDLKRSKLLAEENTLANKSLESADDALILAKEQYSFKHKITAETKKLQTETLKFNKLEERDAEGALNASEKALLKQKDLILGKLKESSILSEKHKAETSAARTSAKTTVVRESAAEKMLSSMKQQEASLSEQLSSEVKLGTEAKKLVELKERLNLIEVDSGTKKLTIENQSLLTNKEALLTQQAKLVSLEQELKVKEELKKVESFKQGLDANLKVEKDKIEDMYTLIGLSDKQKEQAQERNDLEREYAKTLLEMKQNEGVSGDSPEVHKEKIDALEAYYDKRKGLLEDYYEFEAEQSDNWQAGFAEGLANFVDNQMTVFETIRESTENILSSIQDGIAQNLTEAIMYGNNMRETFAALGNTIIHSVLRSLIDVGVQYAINAAKELFFTKAIGTVKKAEIVSTAAIADGVALSSAGVQVGAAATTTTAWTPAAIVASIGSFGTAAAVGLAAVVAALAFTKGFKSGGYTGGGGVNDVAGVVHGKEFVFDAKATSRIGVENLEAMRQGKGMAIGSNSGSSSSSTSTGGTIVINAPITVEASGGSDEEARRQGEIMGEALEYRIKEVMAGELSAGGMLWQQ